MEEGLESFIIMNFVEYLNNIRAILYLLDMDERRKRKNDEKKNEE